MPSLQEKIINLNLAADWHTHIDNGIIGASNLRVLLLIRIYMRLCLCMPAYFHLVMLLSIIMLLVVMLIIKVVVLLIANNCFDYYFKNDDGFDYGDTTHYIHSDNCGARDAADCIRNNDAYC